MKTFAFLAATVLLIGFFYPSGVIGQTPNVQIYFDEQLQVKHRLCPDAPAGSVMDTLYVVAHNFNAQITDIEYRINHNGLLIHLMDLIQAEYIAVGHSFEGIVVSFPTPVDAGATFLIHKIWFIWGCQGCPHTPFHYLLVEPHPVSGKIQATRWPDLVKIEGIVTDNDLCGILPVKPETWGGIKGLYSHR